jgi:acyl carrier protein
MNDMNVFDFFDATDYVGAVQQEFRLKIPAHDLAKIEGLSDLVQYLYERVTQKQT